MEQSNIRAYRPADLARMTAIWNEVVAAGQAFPQTEPLSPPEAEAFFRKQSFAGVAEDADGGLLGLYVLHPNNVGRCGHIANASYAVAGPARGRKVGEGLVAHSLRKAKELGFRLMQFNAVVNSNHTALHLYDKLGFVRLGVIPGGFLNGGGQYEDITLFYHDLTDRPQSMAQGAVEADGHSREGEGKDGPRVVSLREHPEYALRAIAYFQSKWATEQSKMVYQDCISRSLAAQSPLPVWYLLLAGEKIIGGAGLVTNDFISCGDLWPWLVALYIEEEHRGRALGQRLIDRAKQDAARMGFPRLYLSTDHVGYYEKYGFSHIATGYHPWGESSRVYECPVVETTG